MSSNMAQRSNSVKGPAASLLSKDTLDKFNNINKISQKKPPCNLPKIPRAPKQAVTGENIDPNIDPIATSLQQRLKAGGVTNTNDFGKVPEYLQKFKEEAKEKKDRADEAKAARKYPPGTRLIAEDERLATLADLQANKVRVNDILIKMPISMRTESLRKQKTELEIKLLEIDKAISIFSRKEVFVQI